MSKCILVFHIYKGDEFRKNAVKIIELFGTCEDEKIMKSIEEVAKELRPLLLKEEEGRFNKLRKIFEPSQGKWSVRLHSISAL